MPAPRLRRSVRFAGLDLAWSERNLSGWAVLEGDARRVRLVESSTLDSDADILAALRRQPSPVTLGIDAPLVVPNVTGCRAGDRDLASSFARARAGPYPANRTLLLKHGRIRGEDLVRALAHEGWEHDPSPSSRAAPRCIEVYPHPALVSMFGLQERLPYKAKAGRTRATRLKAFARLVEGLAELRGPRLAIDADAFPLDPRRLRGAGLKAFEDRLDAVVCAYVAARWSARPATCRVFGTREAGYIVTPMRP